MKNPFKNDDITENKDEIKEELQETSTENSEAVEESACENSELDKLKTDLETLNSQYVRLAADFENYRKRQEAERENLLRFGTENALKKMIEVIECSANFISFHKHNFTK